MTLLKRGLLNFIVVPLMTFPEDFTTEEIEPMPIAAQTVLLRDHTVETDKETILSLVQALVLLSSSKESREFLRTQSLVCVVFNLI